MRGVSLKTRYRINKRLGIWPKKSVASKMDIIGSEKWNSDWQETLNNLRKHQFNYTEATRLNETPFHVNEIKLRIAKSSGLAPYRSRSDQPPPRKIPFRRNRRELAFRVIDTLLGMSDAGMVPMDNYISPGRLDPRLDWLLHEIYTLAKGTRQRNFLVTVAKHLNVWPSPKWWRVTRRLLGDNRSFEKRSSSK